jgi:hypothetical protein
LDELRGVCRRARIAFQVTPTDYEMHAAFVQAASKSSHPVRLVHKILEKKFRHVIERFSRARNGEALTALWEEAWDKGDIAGAYWALMTHASAPADLVNRAHGEVHMLSHLSGASQRADLRRLEQLDQRCTELEQELAATVADYGSRLVARDKTVQHLRSRLREVEQAEVRVQQLEAHLTRLTRLTNGPDRTRRDVQLRDAENRIERLLRRAATAEEQVQHWSGLATRIESEKLRLAEELAVNREELRTMEAMLQNALAVACDEGCQSEEGGVCTAGLNLCGRRVLYVGGRDRQAAHFRALVERHDGTFIHHDGGLHDGRARLGGILQQADAVFCPVDCVSHDACLRLKRFCKRNAKPLVLLRSASLASFVRGLWELAA